MQISSRVNLLQVSQAQTLLVQKGEVGRIDVPPGLMFSLHLMKYSDISIVLIWVNDQLRTQYAPVGVASL